MTAASWPLLGIDHVASFGVGPLFTLYDIPLAALLAADVGSLLGVLSSQLENQERPSRPRLRGAFGDSHGMLSRWENLGQLGFML